jgi:hypothetical protein
LFTFLKTAGTVSPEYSFLSLSNRDDNGTPNTPLSERETGRETGREMDR